MRVLSKNAPGAASALLAGLVIAACSAAPARAPASAPVRPDPHHGGAHGGPHGGPPLAHAGSGHHRFQDAERWAKVFDDPARDAWQRPDAVVRALGLSQSATVIDLGAGTGYFTVRLARAVPEGKVLAIDVEPDMVDWLKQRAARERLTNVEARLAAPNDPRVTGQAELVLVVDTYHHIEDRPAYFRALAEHLTPNGRVAILDFKLGELPVGPPEAMRIAPAQVEREMKDAGLALCGSYDELPYQYLLFFGVSC
ncbi:MAG: class I SAM-dependent methyltransferase [Sorangiineae bacterium]|nr:class I SAM-dependent methyltransferase [Polyangiaceae bacterium]MEB2323343.1 class I SAM-dependent methyltransferase [Sorangiineae bacterium]